MDNFDSTSIRFPARGVHEEIANTATHGVALVLSLSGIVPIMTAPRFLDVGLTVGCGVYVTTLVIVYAISTLSHAVQRPRPKNLLRAWDQGAIYLLIAGTYTPFMWAYLSSRPRWVMLATIWGIALLGFYSKAVAQHRVNAVATHSYVLLGWVPALFMVNSVSLSCLTWMAVGGSLYTVGTLFLMFDGRFRFFHATWHLFVVMGSAATTTRL